MRKLSCLLLLLLLFSCVKDENQFVTETKKGTEDFVKESVEINNPFLSSANIETFSLEELETDVRFTSLKNTFGILQKRKGLEVERFNTQTDNASTTDGIKLAEDSIIRIRHDDYVSYTILMIESEDTTGDFSNLIIQEHAEKKEMFTVRYFKETGNENGNERQSVSSSIPNIRVLSGMRNFKDLYEHPDSPGGSPSCTDYETICRVVSVLVPTCCGCGHCGNDPCRGCSGVYAGWETEFREECEQVCAGLGVGVGSPAGGSGSDDDSGPTEIATSPINPDGSDEECNSVQKLFKDPALKVKIDYLKTKTGEKKETGFLQNKDNSFTPLAVSNAGHSLKYTSLTNAKGFLHTHVDDFEGPDTNGDGIPDMVKPIKIFSPADVITLLTLSKLTLSGDISLMDVYGMVVTSDKTFVLKFTGTPSAIPNNYPEKSKMKRKYRRALRRSKTDLVGGLLRFAFDAMQVSDLKVFELKPDGTIEKAVLDAEKNTIKTKC